MDTIFLSGLKVSAIIGTLPEERFNPQKLIFDIELHLDLRPAGESDDLTKSVNYQELEAAIINLGASTQFFLLEKLAEESAKICLGYELIQRAVVTITKPEALIHSTPKIRIDRSRVMV